MSRSDALLCCRSWRRACLSSVVSALYNDLIQVIAAIEPDTCLTRERVCVKLLAAISLQFNVNVRNRQTTFSLGTKYKNRIQCKSIYIYNRWVTFQLGLSCAKKIVLEHEIACRPGLALT